VSPRVRSIIVVSVLLLAGCAQQDSGVLCPAFIAVGPLTTLDYPETGATGVPDTVETLIFSGSAPQKIELVPQVTGATPIATMPTAVPSPLPSPIATPFGTTYGYYAVSVPALSTATEYQAQGLTQETSGCGGTTMRYAGSGSFTTQ
jgi:hypothetical protein